LAEGRGPTNDRVGVNGRAHADNRASFDHRIGANGDSLGKLSPSGNDRSGVNRCRGWHDRILHRQQLMSAPNPRPVRRGG
jgi:hypothetical protein